MKSFINRGRIKGVVHNLGRQITRDYQGKDLVVIGLLRGAFIFCADLIREIDLPLEVDFMIATRFNNKNHGSNEVKMVLDLNTSIEGRDVLLVEDIILTGKTFSKVLDILKSRNPNSLKTCVLVRNHESNRECKVNIDYCGFDINDEFICGYGLDNMQKDRNLGDIWIV